MQCSRECRRKRIINGLSNSSTVGKNALLLGKFHLPTCFYRCYNQCYRDRSNSYARKCKLKCTSLTGVRLSICQYCYQWSKPAASDNQSKCAAVQPIYDFSLQEGDMDSYNSIMNRIQTLFAWFATQSTVWWSVIIECKSDTN